MKNNFLGTQCLQILLVVGLISTSTLSAEMVTTNITYGSSIHLYCNETIMRGEWVLKSETGKTGTVASGDKVLLFYHSYKVPVGSFILETKDGVTFRLISGQQQLSSIEFQAPLPPLPKGPVKPVPHFGPISTGSVYNFKKQ